MPRETLAAFFRFLGDDIGGGAGKSQNIGGPQELSEHGVSEVGSSCRVSCRGGSPVPDPDRPCRWGDSSVRHTSLEFQGGGHPWWLSLFFFSYSHCRGRLGTGCGSLVGDGRYCSGYALEFGSLQPAQV